MPSHAFTMRCQVTDETYIKVKGNWTYFYRAVDKNGKTIKKSSFPLNTSF
jgi:transposase-like protein